MNRKDAMETILKSFKNSPIVSANGFFSRDLFNVQDKKSNFTGNIVVEVEFNGKPSALSTTTADYWVFDDGEIYIWTTPRTLRLLIKSMSPVVFVGNGDNKKKKAYLVKKSIVIATAMSVDRRKRN